MLPANMLTDAPTMVIAPVPVPDQYFHDGHYRPANGLPTPPHTRNGSFQPSFPPTPSEGAIAGRKRSRGDIYSPDDENAEAATIEQSTLPSVPQGEPNYGPGMTLIYPNDPSGHYASDASTQSGTWVEETAEQAAARAARPIMNTRKSQRLDSTASRLDDVSSLTGQTSPRASGTEPLIDEATRLLGVSWSRMDVSESTQIAQRAYTRWIDRHYPQLTKVEVWFENSAIPGYLGKATNTGTGLEEYYLWSLDLHQAILVTRNAIDLIVKLSQPQMSLSQATETINADIQPVVEAAAANAAIVHNDRFIVDTASAATSGGMDID